MPSAMPKARKGGTAMRFDLVDLQLFIAVAETRSITQWRAPRSPGAGLRQRTDQGPGSGARRHAAQARPARRRTDRGRRKPARSCPDRDPQCRGDARRSRRLFPRREGERPPARQHLGPVGISAEGAGRLPAPASAHLDRRRGARKRRDRQCDSQRRGRAWACRRARPARQYRADSFQRGPPGAGRRAP